MKGLGGPADIKLTKGEILLIGTTMPCIRIGQSEIVRKVRSADDFYILMEITDLTAPGSAVNIILLPCNAPSI
jgi:hypothetical protein